MGFQTERENFLVRMAEAGMGLGWSRAILRAAGRIQRASEIECSIDTKHLPGLRAYVVGADAASKRITGTLATFPGWKVRTSGDPRGCCVHVWTPDGREHGVPAKGWTARDLDRFGAMAERAAERAHHIRENVTAGV